MKKVYKVFLLLIALTFLTTFNPNKFYLISKKNSNFFAIENIEILNNNLIAKELVKEKLNNIYNKNIFLIDKNDIEELLKEISFFEKVKIKKKYPNAIIIKIYETSPIAIIYKNKSKYLLDTASNLIIYNENMNYEQLPSIFGENAKDNFTTFYKELKKNKFPVNLIKNYYFFQIGRWNIELSNNKIIKFPYENIKNAINKSIELIEHKDFKNYNTIDLRVDDKIIVE